MIFDIFEKRQIRYGSWLTLQNSRGVRVFIRTNKDSYLENMSGRTSLLSWVNEFNEIHLKHDDFLPIRRKT